MKLIIDGMAIEYLDEGEGKTLLFLHGWQDDLRTFDPIIEELAKKFHCIRLDLPGFGASEAPKRAWNLDDYVDIVEKFTNKLDIKVDVLLGHSFGGRIAIRGVSNNRLNPGKVVLISSAGIRKSGTPRNSILKFFAGTFGFLLHIPPFSFWRDKIRKMIYKSIDSDYLDARELKETYLKIIAEDLRYDAKKIKRPTLLIWGKDDEATPVSDAYIFRELIENSKLEVIMDAGHFVHRDKPSEVLAVIQKFV